MTCIMVGACSGGGTEVEVFERRSGITGSGESSGASPLAFATVTRRRGARPRDTLSAEGYGWGRECCVLCAECGEMALPPCREPFEVVEGGAGAEVSFVGFGRLPKVKTSMDEPIGRLAKRGEVIIKPVVRTDGSGERTNLN